MIGVSLPKQITSGFKPPYKEIVMGKYFIAWILGVPAFVLVLKQAGRRINFNGRPFSFVY
jgi:hypothetical protein